MMMMRNRESGRALAILLALVTVVAVAEGIVLIQMDGRLAEVETKVGAGDHGPGATPLALVDEIRSIEAKQEDEIGARESLETRFEALTTKIEQVARAVRERPFAPVKGGGAGPGVPREALNAAVELAVEKKLTELPRTENGEWKPTLDEFQKAFALSDEQTERAERIFDDAKHEAFTLLATKRLDGTSKVDDLVAVFTNPEAGADQDAQAKRFFTTLFTEKIPGREETYIVEILRIKESADRSLKTVLTEEQSKKLSRTNLDHLGVKTGYDPFEEYVRESVR